jgi:hypothetical protein
MFTFLMEKNRIIQKNIKFQEYGQFETQSGVVPMFEGCIGKEEL